MVGFRLGPAGELTALLHTPSMDLRGRTFKAVDVRKRISKGKREGKEGWEREGKKKGKNKGKGRKGDYHSY